MREAIIGGLIGGFCYMVGFLVGMFVTLNFICQ